MLRSTAWEREDDVRLHGDVHVETDIKELPAGVTLNSRPGIIRP